MSYTPQQQPQQPYGPQAQFASAHTRAQLVKALLLANAGLAALALVLVFLLGGSASEGMADGEETISPAALVEGLVALAQFTVYVATIVFFLLWLHRAYKNLRAFGVRTEQTPGWAVGNWFIPILNLFRPYQNVKELWIKSDPDVDFAHGFAQPGPGARDTTIIGLWWAAWLIAGFVDRILFRLMMRADTPGEVSALTPLGVASDLLTIISAVLAFLVVKTIDRMQEEKAARLSVSAWPAPPPPPASFETPPAQP